MTDEDIDWHSTSSFQPNWYPDSRLLAFTLKDHQKEEHLYLAFNAHFECQRFELPPPPKGKKWYRIIDTSLPSPEDFLEEPKKQHPLKPTYELNSHSSLLAKALP